MCRGFGSVLSKGAATLLRTSKILSRCTEVGVKDGLKGYLRASNRTQIIQPLKDLPSNQTAAKKINIRQSRPKDIAVLQQLSHKEGWMCQRTCFNAILKLDSRAFIVAADESDTPVGYVGVCDVQEDVMYLIHFVVRKDLRGEGIGRALYCAMMERIANKNGFIDVIHKDVEFYVKKGFNHKSFIFHIFVGVVSPTCRKGSSNKTVCNVVPLTTNELWHLVLNYDRTVYNGIDRQKMLRTFLSGENIYSVVAMHDGEIKGYGSLTLPSELEDINSIDVLLGDDENIVDGILLNMLEKIPDGSLLTFSLLADKRLSKRFEGFEHHSSQQRLYNKYSLEDGCQTDRIYCVLSY